MVTLPNGQQSNRGSAAMPMTMEQLLKELDVAIKRLEAEKPKLLATKRLVESIHIKKASQS